VKLYLYDYQCGECSCGYKVPHLGCKYGEFLLRDEYGNLAYLNALESTAFHDVSHIVDQSGLLVNASPRKVSQLKQAIITIVSDRSSDGGLYEIGKKAKCPNCGSTNVIVSGPTVPAQTLDVTVERVTFNAWENLSPQEKKSLVLKSLKKCLNLN